MAPWFAETIILVILLLTNTAAHGRSELDITCPAAKEGHPVTAMCRPVGDWGTEHGRWIFWCRRNNRTKCDQIASCAEGTPCDTFARHYSPRITYNGKRFEASLEIEKVNPKHRNNEFECSAVDIPGNIEARTPPCKLNVYHLPNEHNCVISTTKLEGTGRVYNVTIQCGPMRVYPGMTCAVKQKWSHRHGHTIMDKDVKFVYTKEQFRVNGYEYFNQSCSTSFQESHPGDHRYSVQIRPLFERNIDAHSVISKEFGESPVVSIHERKPFITIHDSKQCTDAADYMFVCYGFGFHEEPKFEWLIDDKSVPSNYSVATCNLTGNYSCSSTLSLTDHIDILGKRLTCSVSDGSVYFEKTLKHTFSWVLAGKAAPKLHFEIENQENPEAPLGPSLRRTVYDSHAMLTCLSENLHGLITSLHVVCRHHGQELVREDKSYKATETKGLNFHIPSRANSCVCTCWAMVEGRCHPAKVTLSVSTINHPQSGLFSQESPEQGSFKSMDVAIITAIVVVVIALPTIAFVSCRHVLRRQNAGDTQIGLQGNGGNLQTAMAAPGQESPSITLTSRGYAHFESHPSSQIQPQQPVPIDNRFRPPTQCVVAQESLTDSLEADRMLYPVSNDSESPRPGSLRVYSRRDISVHRESSFQRQQPSTSAQPEIEEEETLVKQTITETNEVIRVQRPRPHVARRRHNVPDNAASLLRNHLHETLGVLEPPNPQSMENARTHHMRATDCVDSPQNNDALGSEETRGATGCALASVTTPRDNTRVKEIYNSGVRNCDSHFNAQIEPQSSSTIHTKRIPFAPMSGARRIPNQSHVSARAVGERDNRLLTEEVEELIEEPRRLVPPRQTLAEEGDHLMEESRPLVPPTQTLAEVGDQSTEESRLLGRQRETVTDPRLADWVLKTGTGGHE